MLDGDGTHLTTLDFPRQPDGDRLCLADYFRADQDVVVLQAVSAGGRAGQYVRELQRGGEYVRMLQVNGLASSTAEALAEYAHTVARRELGLAEGRSLRFSWGYPACPDLDEHAKLFSILPADKIGVTLTEAFQLVPEQSTAVIVVHHPEAKYFSIGSARDRAEGDVEAVAA